MEKATDASRMQKCSVDPPVSSEHHSRLDRVVQRTTRFCVALAGLAHPVDYSVRLTSTSMLHAASVMIRRRQPGRPKASTWGTKS